MSDEPTPMGNRHRGELTLDERLEGIEASLKEIMSKIDGLPIRVRALEVVVYGGCGVVLLAVLTALIALVVKGHA